MAAIIDSFKKWGFKVTEVKRQAALIKLTKDEELMDLGAESPYLRLMLEHNTTKPEAS